MSKAKSQWDVWAVVKGQPLAKQNSAPLTHWNAENMARRLEKTSPRVLLARHKNGAKREASVNGVQSEAAHSDDSVR